VKADNNKLAYENARLKNKVREISQLQIENQRLSRLLSLREAIPDEVASAAVIGKNTTRVLQSGGADPRYGWRCDSRQHARGVGRWCRWNRHARDGDRVDVQLTVDSGFGVDVIVERTGLVVSCAGWVTPAICRPR